MKKIIIDMDTVKVHEVDMFNIEQHIEEIDIMTEKPEFEDLQALGQAAALIKILRKYVDDEFKVVML